MLLPLFTQHFQNLLDKAANVMYDCAKVNIVVEEGKIQSWEMFDVYGNVVKRWGGPSSQLEDSDFAKWNKISRDYINAHRNLQYFKTTRGVGEEGEVEAVESGKLKSVERSMVSETMKLFTNNSDTSVLKAEVIMDLNNGEWLIKCPLLGAHDVVCNFKKEASKKEALLMVQSLRQCLHAMFG